MTEPDRRADPVLPVRPGNFLLELVLVPVSDIDRAKAFYSERAGFGVDVDVRSADGVRVVQLTPRGRLRVMADPAARRRYGIIVGLEFGLLAFCLATLLAGRPFTVIHPMAYVCLDLNRRGKHERSVA